MTSNPVLLCDSMRSRTRESSIFSNVPMSDTILHRPSKTAPGCHVCICSSPRHTWPQESHYDALLRFIIPKENYVLHSKKATAPSIDWYKHIYPAPVVL